MPLLRLLESGKFSPGPLLPPIRGTVEGSAAYVASPENFADFSGVSVALRMYSFDFLLRVNSCISLWVAAGPRFFLCPTPGNMDPDTRQMAKRLLAICRGILAKRQKGSRPDPFENSPRTLGVQPKSITGMDLNDPRTYLAFLIPTLDSAVCPRAKKHPQAVALGLRPKEQSRILAQTQVCDGVKDPNWQHSASLGKLRVFCLIWQLSLPFLFGARSID